MSIGCPECGAIEDIPPLGPRMRASCAVCHGTLERRSGRSIPAALACSLATFVLLLPANLAPLMTVHLLGASRMAQLGSGIITMWGQGWVIMAPLLGLFGILLPLLRFGALTIVLGLVLFDRKPAWLGRLYRWVMWLDLWAMSDVFLVGFFIGYSRVSQHLTVILGAGGYCFVVAAFTTMLTRAVLDRRSVWRAIMPERHLVPGRPAISCTTCDLAAPAEDEGKPCPRCGLVLHSRKPDALLRAGAFSLAGLALYIPANIYPMTIATQIGQDVPHRIIGSVIELFKAGLWPLGILIFCTSIAIPLLKLAGIGWFILSVKRRSRRFLRFKTHLFRAIDELGRWSNVDVFTIAIFVPLMQFGGLVNARPAPGAAAFILVVVLTMAASSFFDPRLMWDAAEETT